MTIQISITDDGTATLHGEGIDPETIIAGSRHQAQTQAIDALISRARASGEQLYAVTDDTPPATLLIEPRGTVTPVPAGQVPSSAPAPAQEQPEQPTAEPATPAAASPAKPAAVTPPPTAAPVTTPAQPAPSRPNPLTADSAAAPVSSRRQVREQRQSFLNQEQREQPATEGWRGLLASMGIRIAPSEAEKAQRIDRQAVSQHWPGPRTIAIVNGKGGASKTPTTILLSAVFARYGGGGVLAYDNNQTRGTLGWRTEQGPHDATILDLLPKANDLLSTGAQSADLAHFVHHQTTDRYDVLRSKPVALADAQRVDAG